MRMPLPKWKKMRSPGPEICGFSVVCAPRVVAAMRIAARDETSGSESRPQITPRGFGQRGGDTSGRLPSPDLLQPGHQSAREGCEGSLYVRLAVIAQQQPVGLSASSEFLAPTSVPIWLAESLQERMGAGFPFHAI